MYNNFINLSGTKWAVLDLSGIGNVEYIAPCRFQQLQRRYITDALEVTSSEWDYMIVCKRLVPLDENDELWIDGSIYHVQAVVRYTSHQEVTMVTYNYTDPGFPYDDTQSNDNTDTAHPDDDLIFEDLTKEELEEIYPE